MEDMVYKRVRAAATAGWWTLLVAIVMSLLQALGVFVFMHARPDWVPALWAGMPWERIQMVVFRMMAVFRLLIWVMFLIVVWLTIWSCKLKRVA
jgi:hypothetical protein